MYATMIGLLSNWLYTYILIILLTAVGLYFSFKTKFVQFRLLKESIKVVKQPSDDARSISSFQALMLSTASRVGVGNISGVSAAICLGGEGSLFWMWIIAIIGGASAFIESTLAQIYKRSDKDGSCYGGPAYYIQDALKNKTLGIIFAIMLILTYMGGFNMLATYNIASGFTTYSFYDPKSTPFIIGIVMCILTGLCIFGGEKRLSQITSILVPFMAIAYIAVALIIMVLHMNLIPGMIVDIFQKAFDFKAIFGGFLGSAIMHGIKRGLYSNEAGVGSSPNAAASAGCSHPVKQGLVQMLSVYIDTIVICTATGFMLLCSGIAPSVEMKGVPYVQAAVANTFGDFGIYFVTFSLFCFAFTTILGNFYYAEANFKYLTNGTPAKYALLIFRTIATLIVFIGAQLEFSIAWDTADVLMGFMALINLPVIVLLCKPAIMCLKDYQKQRSEGKNPVFIASSIDLKEKTDFWHNQ